MFRMYCLQGSHPLPALTLDVDSLVQGVQYIRHVLARFRELQRSRAAAVLVVS